MNQGQGAGWQLFQQSLLIWCVQAVVAGSAVREVQKPLIGGRAGKAFMPTAPVRGASHLSNDTGTPVEYLIATSPQPTGREKLRIRS